MKSKDRIRRQTAVEKGETSWKLKGQERQNNKDEPQRHSDMEFRRAFVYLRAIEEPPYFKNQNENATMAKNAVLKLT